MTRYVDGTLNVNGMQIFPYTESTKQMEQTLRAKVKIFLKSENLKKWF